MRQRGALRTRITVNEPATVKVTARAGRKLLGSATVKVSRKGARTVTLKLTAAGRRAVRRGSRLAVTVSAGATDATGNNANAKATRTLRR